MEQEPGRFLLLKKIVDLVELADRLANSTHTRSRRKERHFTNINGGFVLLRAQAQGESAGNLPPCPTQIPPLELHSLPEDPTIRPSASCELSFPEVVVDAIPGSSMLNSSTNPSIGAEYDRWMKSRRSYSRHLGRLY
jgi:hypothetical protein